jgi:hypothetical protein
VVVGRTAAERQDPQAVPVFTERAVLSERLGDLFEWGWSNTWLATFARQHGELDEAEAILLDVMARREDPRRGPT